MFIIYVISGILLFLYSVMVYYKRAEKQDAIIFALCSIVPILNTVLLISLILIDFIEPNDETS